MPAALEEAWRIGLSTQTRATVSRHNWEHLEETTDLVDRAGPDTWDACVLVLTGRGLVFVPHTGEIGPGGFLPISPGNVRRQSLVDVYRHAALFKLLRDGACLKGRWGLCQYRKPNRKSGEPAERPTDPDGGVCGGDFRAGPPQRGTGDRWTLTKAWNRMLEGCKSRDQAARSLRGPRRAARRSARHHPGVPPSRDLPESRRTVWRLCAGPEVGNARRPTAPPSSAAPGSAARCGGA